MTVCLCVLIFTCVFRPLYRHVELDSVGEIMILMIETEKGYIRSMSCLCERILLFSCLTVFFFFFTVCTSIVLLLPIRSFFSRLVHSGTDSGSFPLHT